MKKESVLICGSGAVGIYLGARLHQTGHKVTLYGRNKLRKIGKKVRLENCLIAVPKKVFQLNAAHYNYIFIATKLPDVRSALADLREANVSADHYVFLQNGLVRKDYYSDFIKPKSAISLVVFGGYSLLKNKVAVNKTKQKWQIENTLVGKKLAFFLEEAGISAEATKKFRSNRVIKFLLVNMTNAMCAIHNQTIGQLFLNERTKKICLALLKEAHTILQKEYSLPSYEQLEKTLVPICLQMTKHYSSMHHDLATGRNTEIEFLNGWVVEEAKLQGLSAPFNASICRWIKRMQKNNKT